MSKLPAAQIKKLFAKARAAQTAGVLEDAAKGYERILKGGPNLPEVHFNLGEVRARQARAADAARHFEAALKLRPGEPAIWLAYLGMAARFPNKDNLRKLLDRVGGALDQRPEIDFFRGVALAETDPDTAAGLFQAAIERGVATPEAPTELAVVLERTGDAEAALAALEGALSLKPDHHEALVRKADLLRSMGDLEGARATARAAIEANPRIGHPYATYASVGKVAADDPMIAQMKSAFVKLKPQSPDRVPLGHALAKVMEDTGQHDQMFRYLDAACATVRKLHPYTIEADRDAATAVRELFAAQPLTPGEPSEPPARPTPIFVTGLPRSGTTLIEQILASHSAVTGGGELGIIGRDLLDGLQAMARKGADEVELRGFLAETAAQYRAALSARFEGAAYVTDKSISTYVAMGFVQVAMPDARFIVVRRDPRDNALSIYKNRFNAGTHRYSNSLSDIALFMRNFEGQLEFWKEKMTSGVLEVRYEDVVADLECQARRIVDHAGLPWEKACLEFHKTTRKVDTLSSAQVRQPIYASSVGAWSRYKPEMAPFIDAYQKAGGTL